MTDPTDPLKVTKNKRMLPNDTAAIKQLYFTVKRRVESWKGGIKGWKEIRNQLNIIFQDRV